MKPFQSKSDKQIEWQDRNHADDLIEVIRKGYPIDKREKANLVFKERMGVTHVNRLLRDIANNAAKAIHTASYVISSIEDMSHQNKDIQLLLSALPYEKSPSAAISELGMLLADLNGPIIDRLEVAMLCTPELFNNDYLNFPLQEYVEEFE